jgi:hypothetical protein
MSIKIRHYKNEKRETELTYATIPFKKFPFLRSYYEDLRKASDSIFGGETYIDPRDAKCLNDPNFKEEVIVVQQRGGMTQNYLSITKGSEGFLVRPSPVLHTVWDGYTSNRTKERKELGLTKFDDVLSILRQGFKPRQRSFNSFKKNNREERFNEKYRNLSKKPGEDMYVLEIMPHDGEGDSHNYSIKYARMRSVVSVNIELDNGGSEQEIEKKMKFYKQQITEKYGVPVRFFISGNGSFEGLTRVFPEKRKSLEQKVSSVVAVGGILGSLFFLGSNLTGNAIANLNFQNSSFLGAGLLIVGLVAGWFWLKGKK